MSLLHIPSIGFSWAGLESQMAGSAGTTGGFSGHAGDHIEYIDLSHQVDIQVASADTIRVHNSSSATRAVNVTLIW